MNIQWNQMLKQQSNIKRGKVMDDAKIFENSHLPHASDEIHQPMRPWGFWSTSVWLLLAYVLAVVIAAALVVGMRLVTNFSHVAQGTHLIEIACNSFCIGFLMLAAKFAGWKIKDYFALNIPSRQSLLPALGCGIIGSSLLPCINFFFDFEGAKADALWLQQVYQQASIAGTLSWLWFSIALAAPIVEEIIFRGFLYQGWSASPLGPMKTILLSSLIFGLIHIQYSWYGILSCLFFGLLMGWLRFRSGSIYPSMLMHASNNGLVMLFLALGYY
jgi:membrane protease YdiL (CAAX protease family)